MDDQVKRIYATGKRKTSIARVWLTKGTGKVNVNNMEGDKYFLSPTHKILIRQPFHVVSQVNKFDIKATVHGGGISGQADSLKHGIAKTLLQYDESLRTLLKKAGMLTRDSRIVERKKYGKHKARKSTQFSKR